MGADIVRGAPHSITLFFLCPAKNRSAAPEIMYAVCADRGARSIVRTDRGEGILEHAFSRRTVAIGFRSIRARPTKGSSAAVFDMVSEPMNWIFPLSPTSQIRTSRMSTTLTSLTKRRSRTICGLAEAFAE
jgi:hypothetical protein